MQQDKIDLVYPQGYKNPINYDEIQTKGYNHKLQDGENTD